jgi:hypothetical protein
VAGGIMAKSNASTVEDYLSELPTDRRAVIAELRDVVLRNLPSGYREVMNWGMICYEVPLERYPNTYNGQPLGYISLAAQKNYFALYLPCVYQDPRQQARLQEGFRKAGKKLDMGKSCLRFRKLEDLPLDAIADTVAATTPDEFIAGYERSRQK